MATSSAGSSACGASYWPDAGRHSPRSAVVHMLEKRALERTEFADSRRIRITIRKDPLDVLVIIGTRNGR